MAQTIKLSMSIQQAQQEDKERKNTATVKHQRKLRSHTFSQFLRFALVGGLNTVIDLLVLNGLLWMWPTQATSGILLYNSLAYTVGAINSFVLNKYWTFRYRQRVSPGEILRFTLTTLGGITGNDVLLWLASDTLHPVMMNSTLWANVSKVFALCGTICVSYLGMRLWVFVHRPQEKNMMSFTHVQQKQDHLLHGKAANIIGQCSTPVRRSTPLTTHSLSVVLPAFNEEQVIASTINDIRVVLAEWVEDFEIIIVNDGSTDDTDSIVASLATGDSRIHVITHATNQGYGATIADGFSMAIKELTFFMDSDGQFDIRDLADFFLFIDEYDAVIGYRIDRQDTWMRKLNAWGWKILIGAMLDVSVHDLDCAFKLLRTDFLHSHPLETRGAMMNAELLYKLTRSGATYRQIGVHHLPRLSGKASGAKPAVILRALRELFFYKRKWQRAQREAYTSITFPTETRTR